MPTTPSYERKDSNTSGQGNDEDPDNSSSLSQREKPLYMSNPFLKAALVKGNFKTIVTLPRYCDMNEVSLEPGFEPHY